ncbi:MAG: hypothetical protein ICV83_08340 [Cytophagales bacterium]|nr:hypothetical protein [Cytophagales bacterium]
MNTNPDLAGLLARTRALVAESRQVRMSNQELYMRSRQAAADAQTLLQAQRERLQGITAGNRFDTGLKG